MKNFSSKTKANYRLVTKRGWWALGFLGVCVLGLIVWSGDRLITHTLGAITYPLYATRTWLDTSTAILPSYWRGQNQLRAEIEGRDRQLAEVSGYRSLVASLMSENAELRQQLGDQTEPRVGAGIIGRPPFLPYDSLLIDQGSDAGISEGALVYYHDVYALGYIARVFPHSALVTLFSHPNVEFTAFLRGPDIIVTGSGRGGGVMRLNVPQGLPLSEGLPVVLPTFAHGLIGEVTAIESVPTEPEQYAYLTHPTSLQSIRTVTVSARTIATVDFETATTYLIDTLRSELLLPTPTTTLAIPLTVPTTTTSTPSLPE
jgi:hypothetical protein